MNSKGGPVDLMGCGGRWGASSERTQDSSTKTRVLTYIMSLQIANSQCVVCVCMRACERACTCACVCILIVGVSHKPLHSKHCICRVSNSE